MVRGTSGPVFFFSSRRRHTRYIGDWSSDVCSSDLALRRARRDLFGCASRQLAARRPAHVVDRAPPPTPGGAIQWETAGAGDRRGGTVYTVGVSRSEERRVGKECRSRGETERKRKQR